MPFFLCIFLLQNIVRLTARKKEHTIRFRKSLKYLTGIEEADKKDLLVGSFNDIF